MKTLKKSAIAIAIDAFKWKYFIIILIKTKYYKCKVVYTPRKNAVY